MLLFLRGLEEVLNNIAIPGQGTVLYFALSVVINTVMVILAIIIIITVAIVLRKLHKASKIEIRFEAPQVMVKTAVQGVVKTVKQLPSQISSVSMARLPGMKPKMVCQQYNVDTLFKVFSIPWAQFLLATSWHVPAKPSFFT